MKYSYSNIVNYGLFSQNKLSKEIDRLNPEDREWEKANIFRSNFDYLFFLSTLLDCRDKSFLQIQAEIQQAITDFTVDTNFKKEFKPKLALMEVDTTTSWRDVRFNSLTLYVCIRLMKPRLVVETGVAAGKSSTMILLALNHNKFGKLVSIDLPNQKGNVLADGARTSTGDFPVGFLVPNYLRDRWELVIGDSKEILPSIVNNHGEIDIFFHDSLHTYGHVFFELSTVYPALKANTTKRCLLLCDDIDIEAGKAFNDFLVKEGLVGSDFRELGGVLI